MNFRWEQDITRTDFKVAICDLERLWLEANTTRTLVGDNHEFSDRGEDGLKLSVISLFKHIQSTGHFFVTRKKFSQTHESTHNLKTRLNRGRAAENAG